MIIAMISQKGGVGKSTVALAIAHELLARGSSVLCVDADAEKQGTLLEASQLAAERGLNAPATVAMRAGMHKADQLPKLAAGFEHVVIDTPGRSDEVQASALLVADLAIIPVGQFAPDVWALRAAVETLRKAQHFREELGGALLMTRVMPRTALGKDLRRGLRELEVPVLKTQITHRTAWGESIGAGVGVAQYAKRDSAAKEARSLVNEILNFHAKAQGRAA